MEKIITTIRKMGKPVNVVITLDMAKTYDRVSWFFLIKVLRKTSFSNVFIHIIWSLISNNWYLVLINGSDMVSFTLLEA